MTWLEDMEAQQSKTLGSLREGKCGCHACIEARGHTAMHMVVCPTCGNKRCPKATWHKFICTNSNEAGQPGSIYGPGV